ncbi:NAD(P)-dependent oxidoreductase [Caulobacter soli]|uniref:NAD(P)-dependent oxidoreductase n=1 Tax=Caulobacter soli TaxID=2708539 RepID=UPI0013ED4D66|nr:NAD(P)-dependent oxidoreductase [Caulobacter soli]
MSEQATPDRPAPVFGFIGLGDMGLPMARRLLAAGLQVVAWNRSPDKLAQLALEGALIAAASPAEVGARADLIGLCLTSDVAVEAVVFGPGGLLSAAPAGARRWIADFSTGDPQAAKTFAERAAALGAGWVDAPVSGGVRGASSGQLVVFAGGEAQDLEALAPLMAPLAARVTHMGPSGAGQATKICNQMIVACNVMMIAETLAVGRRAGVEVSRLPQALAGGFADSAPLQIFGPRMAEHLFLPRLGAIGLMAKDVGLALQLAGGAAGLTPLTSLCAKLYDLPDHPEISKDEDLSKLIGLFETLDR